MNIVKIKSGLPQTEYAPSWNISIGVSQWIDAKKVDTIRNWLIANEDRIKSMYPPLNDGGTGLGDNSVTSRFGRYNLFEFANELPELHDLLTFFRLCWLEFISKEYTSHQELEIVCWFNIVRNEQKIREHLHGAIPTSYLSGNMHLDNYPTSTNYRAPFTPGEYTPIKNVKGGITIFPSFVPHNTTVYNSTDNTPRLSIAFDLRIPNTTDLALKTIKFMDMDIFKQLTGQ